MIVLAFLQLFAAILFLGARTRMMRDNADVAACRVVDDLLSFGVELKLFNAQFRRAVNPRNQRNRDNSADENRGDFQSLRAAR